jgi:hypothetical protein
MTNIEKIKRQLLIVKMRKQAVAVYLATGVSIADDLSRSLLEAAELLEKDLDKNNR